MNFKRIVIGGQKKHWVFGKGVIWGEEGENHLFNLVCLKTAPLSFLPVTKLFSWFTVSSSPLRYDWRRLRGVRGVLSRSAFCMLVICVECRLPDEHSWILSFPQETLGSRHLFSISQHSRRCWLAPWTIEINRACPPWTHTVSEERY